MDKVWHSYVIKYLQKKGLISKNKYYDSAIPLQLSIVQKWTAEFRRGEESFENYHQE